MKKLFVIALSFFMFACSEEDSCSPTPTLTSDEVSNITDTSVTISGTIEAPTCDPTVTSQGFVYGLSTLPKITDEVIEVNGKVLSKEITGLQQNQTYYYRTYFTNPTGTYYGNEIMFKTQVGVASSNPTNISNIAAFSAEILSSITTNGGGEISLRGVCWNTTGSPTTTDSKTENGSGMGSFTNLLTKLTKGTKYYVRTYAVNQGGTTYSEERSFTTRDGVINLTTNQISNIRVSSATIAGNITDDGGAEITARGFCWSTNPTPTIADSKTEEGSGLGGFGSSLIGLTEDTTYNVRSYATNEAGTTYGEQVAFTTQDGIVLFATTSISNIRVSSATIAGNITDDGGATITARGFCWSTNPTPTIADSKTEEGSGLGSFGSSLTGLTEDSIYYVRVYATNEIRTTYGEEISFKTYENLVYLDANGITVKAKDNAEIGSMGMVNGVEYTVVDDETLRNMIEYEDVTTVCTSRITDMSEIVKNTNYFNADISTWDVSNVTDMTRMFRSATSFNQNLSAWDVSNVTNMESMFSSAWNFNQDLSAWDVSNVTTMSYMFSWGSGFNQDLSTWDVSNVTTMENMFYYGSFNQDLSAWDVSNVRNMSAMFASSPFNQDLSAWDVSNVTSMVGMFSYASSFNQDLSSWDVSNVTSMGGMFNSANTFNQDLSAWDVSNVTNMSGMFMSDMFIESSFNQDLSSWDVSNVTNMREMFSNASSFNQKLNAWDVSSVTDMSYMFEEAYRFNRDLSAWDVSNVTTMNSMFNYAGKFNQDLSAWDVSNVIQMNYFSSNTSDWTLPKPNFN